MASEVTRKVGNSKFQCEDASEPSKNQWMLGDRIAANHFDVVPVGPNYKCCIIIRMILTTNSRRTIVFASRLQRLLIKRINLLAIFGDEC